MGVKLMQFWLDNWQYLVTLITVLGGGAWTVRTYFERRSDDLTWKRTEFLFAQAQYIETDAHIAGVLRILAQRDAVWTIEELVSTDQAVRAGREELLQHLDKTLDVFDRLAYAVFTAKTLTVTEASVFGWYLDKIVENTALREYCDNNGFSDVCRLARLIPAVGSLEEGQQQARVMKKRWLKQVRNGAPRGSE